MAQKNKSYGGLAKVAIGAAIACLALLLLSGCSSEDIAEKVVNSALEKEGVKVDVENNKQTIETPEGKVTVGEKLKLPDNFPKNIPVYKKSKITSHTTNGDSFFLTAETKDSPKPVIKYYKSAMKKEHWELSQEVLSSGGAGGGLLSFSNGIQIASITIGQMGDDRVSIAISVGPDESATTTTNSQ